MLGIVCHFQTPHIIGMFLKSYINVSNGPQKKTWSYIKTFKNVHPCDPEILLLGVFPKENIKDAEKDLSIRIFTAKLFVVEKKSE